VPCSANVAALAMTLTIGVAASYQWFEKPFFKLNPVSARAIDAGIIVASWNAREMQ
jgi:hypothetical protein